MASRILPTLLALAAVVVPAAALDVPYLSGRVNDLADLLPADVEQRVEEALLRLEEDTGAQVAVLTVPGLEGEPLEDYALRVAETWQLGRKDVDDGVLLLIARDDRKIRLEVGYGLEPVLTDALSRRIIDDVLRPRFRAGEFGAGVEEAVAAVAAVVRGEDAGLPEPSRAGSPFAEEPAAAAVGLLVFVVVIGMFSMVAAFTKGCAGWFLYVFLMPFYLAFPAALVAPWLGGLLFVAWVVVLPVLRLWLWRTDGGKAFRTSHPTWVSMGSSGGGWSSGGGFSGGGFSGGGGSFGGGGASGGW